MKKVILCILIFSFILLYSCDTQAEYLIKESISNSKSAVSNAIEHNCTEAVQIILESQEEIDNYFNEEKLPARYGENYPYIKIDRDAYIDYKELLPELDLLYLKIDGNGCPYCENEGILVPKEGNSYSFTYKAGKESVPDKHGFIDSMIVKVIVDPEITSRKIDEIRLSVSPVNMIDETIHENVFELKNPNQQAGEIFSYYQKMDDYFLILGCRSNLVTGTVDVESISYKNGPFYIQITKAGNLTGTESEKYFKDIKVLTDVFKSIEISVENIYHR